PCLRVLEVRLTAGDIDEQGRAADCNAADLTVPALRKHVVRRDIDINVRSSWHELSRAGNIGNGRIVIDALGSIGRIPDRVVRSVVVDFYFGPTAVGPSRAAVLAGC